MKISALTWVTLLAFSHAFANATSNTVEKITPQEVEEAALYGQKAIIENAIKQRFDVNTPNIDQRTPLMFAAFNGQTEIVKMLIKAEAEIEAQDNTGTTALMFAASAPNGKEAVTLLLEAGAHINQIDTNEHFTALMWAAAEGQLENVQLLLKHGADLALTDIDGDTAETFAAKAGHTAIAQLLKEVATKNNAKAEKE